MVWYRSDSGGRGVSKSRVASGKPSSRLFGLAWLSERTSCRSAIGSSFSANPALAFSNVSSEREGCFVTKRDRAIGFREGGGL